MKTYALYDSEGLVVRQVKCLDGEIENYLSDGLKAIETEQNPVNKKIVNGTLVDVEIPEPKKQPEIFSGLNFVDQRNIKLAQSDWTQFADSPLTDKKKAEWATYRQALRDLPQNNPDITSTDDIVWPTPPSSGAQ